MNEFEWRQQMLGLREPLAPRPELWASIDAALDALESTGSPVASRTAGAPHERTRRWLMAASFAALALLGAAFATHYVQVSRQAVIASASPTVAHDWKPADPRLAGAATQLDAARKELQQAMQQAPNSPALQRLLKRTEQQQTQLQQLANEAG